MSELTTQTAREILAHNTKLNLPGNLTSFNTTATTFGELKNDLLSNNIPFNDMMVSIGETNNSLMMDSAVLPEGSFTLFFTPIQNKSGMAKQKWDVQLVSNKSLTAGIKALRASSRFGREATECFKGITKVGEKRDVVRAWITNKYKAHVRFFEMDTIDVGTKAVVKKSKSKSKSKMKAKVKAKAKSFLKEIAEETGDNFLNGLNHCLENCPNDMVRTDLERMICLHLMRTGNYDKAVSKFKALGGETKSNNVSAAFSLLRMPRHSSNIHH